MFCSASSFQSSSICLREFDTRMSRSSGAWRWGLKSVKWITKPGKPSVSRSLLVCRPDGGVTWVLTFSGNGVTGNSIANGEYQIVLNNSAVSAVSVGGTLASSDTENFYRLYGDTVGNGHYRVNGTDNTAYLSTYGLRSTAPTFSAYLDINDDGRVNGTDNTGWLSDYGFRYSGFTATI
jgi:hypothetical protein